MREFLPSRAKGRVSDSGGEGNLRDNSYEISLRRKRNRIIFHFKKATYGTESDSADMDRKPWGTLEKERQATLCLQMQGR